MLITKITKNWFNGTPIYNSERDDKEHKNAESKFCSFQQTCSLQIAMPRIPRILFLI